MSEGFKHSLTVRTLDIITPVVGVAGLSMLVWGVPAWPLYSLTGMKDYEIELAQNAVGLGLLAILVTYSIFRVAGALAGHEYERHKVEQRRKRSEE